jgi:hypothetical protein
MPLSFVHQCGCFDTTEPSYNFETLHTTSHRSLIASRTAGLIYESITIMVSSLSLVVLLVSTAASLFATSRVAAESLRPWPKSLRLVAVDEEEHFYSGVDSFGIPSQIVSDFPVSFGMVPSWFEDVSILEGLNHEWPVRGGLYVLVKGKHCTDPEVNVTLETDTLIIQTGQAYPLNAWFLNPSVLEATVPGAATMSIRLRVAHPFEDRFS